MGTPICVSKTYMKQRKPARLRAGLCRRLCTRRDSTASTEGSVKKNLEPGEGEYKIHPYAEKTVGAILVITLSPWTII